MNLRTDKWIKTEPDGTTRDVFVEVDEDEAPQTVTVTYEVLAQILTELGLKRA